MEIKFSIDELQGLLDGTSSIEGETSSSITGIASLSEAKTGDLSFLGNTKYKNQVPTTKATVVILPKEFAGIPQKSQVYIRVANPSWALGKICQKIEQMLWPKPIPGVHPSAIVDPTAEIAASASIGPLCTIAARAKIKENVMLGAGAHVGIECEIGEGSWLMPRAIVLDYCKIGKRVRLHSGVVIGGDGFGYEFQEGRHQKVPQIGNVVIENDVEVGPNTTIDRARFSTTRVGEGTKIDNLVQLGHNVVIGKHCLIVSQTGIAGSTTVEDYAVIGGQVGIVGHVKIGKGAMIGSQSGINHDIEAGSYVRGSPAYPFMTAHRLDVLKKRLPEMFERIKKLEELTGSLSLDTAK